MSLGPATPGPETSVIIPAYNAAETIVRALASVQGQGPAQTVETIVIDDRSTDDTAATVERAGFPGVRLIRLDRQHGVGGARNVGLREARGRFVAFLDADDEWLPGKLERQVPLLREDPNVRLVCSDCIMRGLDGPELLQHSRVRTAEGPDAWKQLLLENFMPTPTVVCRREDVLAAGGFRETMRFGEDLDLWLRLAMQGSVRVVDVPLVRVHSMATGLSRSQQKVELEFVLPLIERYVESAGPALTAAERRKILGTRYFNIGFRTYASGHPREAVPLFARAIRLGWRIPKSLALMVDAALGAPLRGRRSA